MISVLIPVYNYRVFGLVDELQKQLALSGIKYEIRCRDDASDNEFTKRNERIRKFENTYYSINKTNLGRVATRQLLAEASNFDWLLFLDADVMPKNKNFVKNYIQATRFDCDAVFGGFAYQKKSPPAGVELRWIYGGKNEHIKASLRNKKPYKVVISANFLIKKSEFKKLNKQISNTGYGLDNYFGSLLNAHKVKVKHIDNEVFHLGLESNQIYLRKKEQAAETLLHLYESGKITAHENDLLKLYVLLKKYSLVSLFSWLYKIVKTSLKKNLTGSKPSVNLLQFYRISYLCYITNNP